MSYEQCRELLDILYKRRSTAYSYHDTFALHEKFDRPADSFPTIHIGGTNGKGSVSTKIANTLTNSGLKVGLFTSPHVHAYRERIQIDGVTITDEDICEIVEPILDIVGIGGDRTTFFSATFMLALLYFRREKVDIAVIEVGLGGKKDPTNIISPLLSIITTIGHDHLDILGTSIEGIAKIKAGIIKEGTPAILGASAARQEVLDQAKERNAPVTVVPTTDCVSYDEENKMIAREALVLLAKHYPITEEAIEKGLNTNPPCRFEEFNHLIFDVAHNPEAFEKLFQRYHATYDDVPFSLILSMATDKDILSTAKLIAEQNCKVYLPCYPHSLLFDSKSLLKIFSSIGYRKVEVVEDLTEIFKRAKDEKVLIAGSFHLMDYVKERAQLFFGDLTKVGVELSEVGVPTETD